MDTKKVQKEEKSEFEKLIEKRDKPGIVNFLLKGLQEKYKSERGDYIVKVLTPELASDFTIIVQASEIHYRIPKTKKAMSKKLDNQKPYYTRPLTIDSTNFFENLHLFIKEYKKLKKSGAKAILGYEIPSSTRSKETLEETAKSFSF